MPAYSTSVHLQQASTPPARPSEKPPTLAEFIHQAVQVAEEMGYTSEDNQPTQGEDVSALPVSNPPQTDQALPRRRRKAVYQAKTPARRTSTSLASSYTLAEAAPLTEEQFRADMVRMYTAIVQLTGEIHQANEK